MLNMIFMRETCKTNLCIIISLMPMALNNTFLRSIQIYQEGGYEYVEYTF